MSSQGKKYPYPLAQAWATKYAELISPFCKLVQIVGSVRRHKAEIGDIEILCIPVQCGTPDLFGVLHDDPNNNLLEDNLADVLPRVGAKLKKDGPKYKCFVTQEGISVDLFISTPETLAVELVIRTGPAEFSKRCVTIRQKGGYLPSNCKVADGWKVNRGLAVISMQSEREFLEFLGLGWVEPWDRNERLVAGESRQPGRVS